MRWNIIGIKPTTCHYGEPPSIWLWFLCQFSDKSQQISVLLSSLDILIWWTMLVVVLHDPSSCMIDPIIKYHPVNNRDNSKSPVNGCFNGCLDSKHSGISIAMFDCWMYIITFHFVIFCSDCGDLTWQFLELCREKGNTNADISTLCSVYR